MRRSTDRGGPLPFDDAASTTPAFGPYRVLHQIGSGVLGPVFRAFDREADRLIAIKVFQLDVTPEVVARVASGLRALAARRSPHASIVWPTAAGLEGARAFVALPLVSGESLDARLRHATPHPLDETLRLLGPVAAALDAAAAAGLRHGSLHPRDLIVDADRAHVHITGFGIGAALEAAGATAPIRRAYAAPERRTPGVAWDARADVYSLAAIAHELLTGRRPVSAGEQDGAFGADVTPEQRVVLRQTLARALAARPEDRFQTATEFVEWLDLVSGPLRRIVVEPPRPAEEAAVPVIEPLATAPMTPVVETSAVTLSEPAAVDLVREIAPVEAATRPVPAPPVLDTALLSFGEIAPVPARSGFTRRRLAAAMMITAAGVGLGAGVGYLVHASRSRPRPAAPVAGPVAATPSDTEVPMMTGAPASRTPETASRVMAVTGQLVVRSQPAGAIVTIDGALYGETPATFRDLPLGTHVVQIARPGHEPRVERVTMTSEAPVQRVNVELVRGLDLGVPARGTINVDSRPRGARVLIDGRYVGLTPLRWPDAAPGAHRVVLDLSGYTRATIPVTVRAGEPARVAATLQLAARPKERE